MCAVVWVGIFFAWCQTHSFCPQKMFFALADNLIKEALIAYLSRRIYVCIYTIHAHHKVRGMRIRAAKVRRDIPLTHGRSTLSDCWLCMAFLVPIRVFLQTTYFFLFREKVRLQQPILFLIVLMLEFCIYNSILIILELNYEIFNWKRSN